MKFCEDCHNMLYFKIKGEDDNTEETKTDNNDDDLIYYCRCCSKVYNNIHNTQESVYSISFNNDNLKKQNIINKYTHNDPTLPKTTGIKCPNENCPSKKPEIIYINYDEINMKYIYMCLDCHKKNISPHIW